MSRQGSGAQPKDGPSQDPLRPGGAPTLAGEPNDAGRSYRCQERKHRQDVPNADIDIGWQGHGQDRAWYRKQNPEGPTVGAGLRPPPNSYASQSHGRDRQLDGDQDREKGPPAAAPYLAQEIRKMTRVVVMSDLFDTGIQFGERQWKRSPDSLAE